MNTKTFVNKVNKLYKKEAGSSMVDNGYRVRITKECQEIGDNIIELGHSYYYESQAHVDSTADEVRFMAMEMGISIKLVPITDKRFNMAVWPKTSWATQLYKVEFI